MTCSNCFNGCAQITSDKCVKYTGVDVPTLGIANGDTLCAVEEALATYLQTALNGTGIVPTIDPLILCTLVSQYLPISGDITIVHIVSALIQAACDLQTQVDDVVADVTALEGDYTIECLTGVTAGSGTHAVLQAVITNLCALNGVMESLLLSLPLTYVALADLDQLIQQYLDTIVQTSKMRNKMVPWAAQEYYGDLTGKFDASGAGLVGTDWEDIYICNGNNGTPDKRGRVAVGVIDNTVGLDPEVSPIVSAANPNYTPWDTTHGTNTVTLDVTTLPAHTHTAAGSSITQTPHFHYEFNTDLGPSAKVTALQYSQVQMNDNTNTFNYTIQGSNTAPTLGRTSSDNANVTVNVVNDNTGGGLAHSNIQPAIACYYIMYIPHP